MNKKIALREAISIGIGGMVGSGIFAVVNFVGFRLRDEINGNKIIPLAGFLLCIAALFILIGQQYASSQTGVLVAISIFVVCFLMEWIYKRTELSNINRP